MTNIITQNIRNSNSETTISCRYFNILIISQLLMKQAGEYVTKTNTYRSDMTNRGLVLTCPEITTHFGEIIL
jgi:hypothetical protein